MLTVPVNPDPRSKALPWIGRAFASEDEKRARALPPRSHPFTPWRRSVTADAASADCLEGRTLHLVTLYRLRTHVAGYDAWLPALATNTPQPVTPASVSVRRLCGVVAAPIQITAPAFEALMIGVSIDVFTLTLFQVH